MSTTQTKFARREVALRRVEWIVDPPDAMRGEEDYDRYENDRMEVMKLIKEECGHSVPHDVRVIEQEEETIISYEVQRVILPRGNGQ